MKDLSDNNKGPYSNADEAIRTEDEHNNTYQLRVDQLSASAVSGFREPAKPPLKTQDNFYKSKAAMMAIGAGSMPYAERGKNTDAR